MTSATCKPNSSFPLKPLAAAVLLVFSANVQTAPILDGVLGNNLDLDVSLPGTTVITQTVNQRDVIRWQEFSIGSGETVRFVQPNADSVILNRVVGSNSSEIFGSLVANGRIFLINPSGIVFGAGSQVNVGSLVASTLNLKGNGNGNGQMPGQTIEFEADANAGSILNAGSITGKDIVFLAPSITNSGNLTAGLQPQHQAGSGVSVNLIAAKEVTVNTSGSDLVVQAVEGHHNALIQQLGQVLAEGGRIILLASASNNGNPSVINTAGVNRASRISIEGDLIQLIGSLNVGNPQGTVDVIAGEVGQMRNGQSAALLSDGGLNINSRGGLSLNNAGNDFTGSVDLTATGSVAVHDSNNLQVSVDSGGEATLSAQNLAINSLASDGLTVNASGRIEQTGPVQVNGSAVLNANEINLRNPANQFDGNVLINSTAGTTLHTNGELNISGSAAQLNLTAAEITQSAALSVAGLSTLNANQVNLLESDNDFAGNVELAVTGAATLIDMNSLAVSGSAGAATLSAVNQVQLNELTVESLNITAASIAQNGTLTVQQGTSLNASAVQLEDISNDFGGNVELGNVGTAELADESELSLSGQVNNLTATARNTTQSAQAVPLTVNNTATFNGENVELIQLGNIFRGQVVLNLDGQVQLGSAEGVAVSGRAASAVFNVDSIRQGTTEADALNVLGQTRINNSNSVQLNNAANRFGSSVVLHNAGAVNLNGNDTLTVQGSADDVTLTTGSNGQIVVNGLNANSLSATAIRIDQTDFLNVTGTSALSAQHIDSTESGNNQFGSTVTLASSESAAIKANGTLTVAGNVVSGSVEADSLVFNGLTASNGLAMRAGSITQSMDVDRALQVQGETRINNSGAVALNNAMNDFNGDVVLNTQGSVRLRDNNTLTIEGQAGSLDLTALSIAQSDSLVVETSTALNAAAVSLNNPANDFQGQVNLLDNPRVSLRDENTLHVAGNAQELELNANTVEIDNALTVNESLTLTSNVVTQAASGSAALTVGGDTSITHRNSSSNTLVRLNNANNDFVGLVTLNNQVNVELADRNMLTVQGDVGTLNVRASQLAQAGSLTVRNNATIEAAAVDVNHQANDFQGRLSLNVAGDAQVADTNSLRVAGNVNTATMNASTLILDGLAAQGNVTFNAASTGQSDVLSVAGTSTFNGDSIALDNQANSFSDVVHLNLTGAASITASGGLDVSGTATSVNAKANSLSVSSLASENIVLQADQLELNNFSTTGNLTLNGGNVIQQGALQVGGTTTLGASNVTLQDEANNFVGNVVLNSAGSVNLRDQQVIALQGSAGSLNVQAGTEISQSGALNVNGNSNLAAPTINLINTANSFGGGVTVNATQQATVNVSGDLLLGGNAAALTVTAQNELDLSNSVLGSLNATAQHITQTGELLVTGATELTAQAVDLRNEHNNFSGPVTLDVAVQADIADNNDLLLQGQSQILNTSVVGRLTAGELNIASGTLIAGEINVNQLEVANSAELQAGKVTQTQASQTGGSLTLRANEVDLAQAGNDFSGQIILQNVGTATISDTNDLALSGRVNELIVNAQRITQQQSQSGALNVQGRADLRAANIDLQNAANNFGGVVDLQVSDTAQLRDVNNLVLQGEVGTLNVKATQLAQAGSLTVRNNATIEAAAVDLNHQANDFQGNVAFNVSGTTVVADANVLNVSGQLNGAAELRAQSIEQAGTLTTNSSVLLQADHVDLGNQGNSFNSLVRVEDANEATLSSAGTLRVQGANLGTLNLQAQEASLGELGELQQLDVAAVEVRQTAALNVKGDTNLRSGRVNLNNPDNDFVGKITVQNPDSANSSVSISDKNDLSMQGENLALAARVLGNFELQANNVELGSTQVDGASQIELTGAITQSRSVMLNDASLTAAQISLTNSGNRFNGNTQVQSSGSVALGTSGNLNIDTTSSSGTLALNVGGNAEVSGMQVQFADSQFDGELAVSANQISQVGRLQVGGDARFESIGGEIDLQHADNRFRGTVSASAEQTRLSTLGDMQLLNLNSRGGQLTADGRMLLLGTIEQTGGALTFTAKGVSRPLSSADIALVLPPSLDVFSSKEAVNPFTGLGRITVASPMIHQRSGQLLTTAGATTQFNSPENGSIVLTQNNQINGQVGVLAGQSHNQSFSYVADRGASLFAVNNDVRLNIGGQGTEADLIAVRARGLATQGSDAVIRARMPYNDLAVGTARSYAGLTLSIPLGGVNGQPGGLATFGESSGSGQSAGTGAIRVEVGDINRPGLGGFLTVLPFEGSNLLPGQVVYLAGPERKGTQAFFYDGARSLDRIPVVYNGTLLLSPQEAAALTTAQGAVVLARQEQTRSVVRTENVAGKIINGVVAEVGPGRPATEGEGGATKPATCDAEDSGLSCAP
ncbi:filamentous hemagglutinin N-terminal domain-containing protein [Limnobacter sp. P1]|uniref:two-partner secretion domain-containing protein n=1 Tax=Limnobacter olei TaxID=3031298 RepID=UPI0023AF4A91|nr:filamentous hemagglutinin N-terminal domain-containing protein [Limnobacter sp. P1]